MNRDDEAVQKAVASISDSFARGLAAGRKLEAERMLPFITSIFVAYHRACSDSQSKMPTALHLAIAAAHLEFGNLHLMPKEPDPNAYAESMIRKDQRDRLEGPADFDTRARRAGM